MLLGEGGRDASKAWDDVQHSAEARELMKDYLVGYSFEVGLTLLSSLGANRNE